MQPIRNIREDVIEYEKQKADYEKAVQQLEAEQKAEADKAESIKLAEQKKVNQQKTINDKYDAQITALGAKPLKYYYKPKYSTNRYTGKKRFIGNTRESNNKAIKNYNSKVDAINRERKIANSNFNLANSHLPQWAKTKAARAWNPTSFKNTSAVTLAQRYYNNYLIKSERTRESSITTARSNAVLAREEHKKTIREYEAKKDSTPVIPSIIEKPLLKATKTRPKVHPSSYFKSTEKTPVSIFGTTLVQSQKAEETYDNTQAQQKELFSDVTGAINYKQAISFREKAQEKNPYVGTANTVYYKGDAIGSSGVLIEKKLHEKPEKDIFEELAKPISPNKDNTIQTDVIPTQDVTPEIKPQVTFSQNSQIPTYQFSEQIIPLSNPKHYESWSMMSSFLDMEPKMPSHTDKLINQYIQNNQKQIHNPKNTGETTIIKIPVLDAVKDYGVEFGLGLASLYTTAKGKLYNEPESATLSEIEKIYNDNPHEKSLEAVLFDSALSQSKNTPAMIHPSSATPSVIPKKESTSVRTSSSYVKEKAQTWEGAEYLAGTIGISVLGAFVPFGRGKSVTQAVKPTLKVTPQSPNNLAYLLKTTAQEPKIITKKVTVADGGSFDVIDFEKMKHAKITPHTPTISEKIQKRPNKFKKELSDKVDQTIGKEIRKLEFKNTMYQHELEKSAKTAKTKDTTSKKPSRDNPISKASRKLKFENDMYHHNLEKSAPKTIETPMLDKVLGKSSRYVKTSVAINNKKIKDKSTQIKDTISDTISDNIVNPVSKKTKPVGKFLKKVKVSKDINQHKLEKIIKRFCTKRI